MTSNPGIGLSVKDISMRFRTDAGVVHAVEGVTLDVGRGESLAVLGASGGGKSTLLSLIGLLERPSQGTVCFDGEPVSHLPEAQRAALRRTRLGFVFQNANLQPFLTVGENVALALALAGSEGADRVADLLDELGVAHLAARFPDALSGGERQRVAVARALVHRPRLLLADEPTGSLDSQNSSTVFDLLVAAQHSVGSTLVVITHNRALAQRLDHVVELHDGRLRAEPRPGGSMSVAGFHV